MALSFISKLFESLKISLFNLIRNNIKASSFFLSFYTFLLYIIAVRLQDAYHKNLLSNEKPTNTKGLSNSVHFHCCHIFTVYDVCFQIMIVYKRSGVIINVWNATQVDR